MYTNCWRENLNRIPLIFLNGLKWFGFDVWNLKIGLKKYVLWELLATYDFQNVFRLLNKNPQFLTNFSKIPGKLLILTHKIFYLMTFFSIMKFLLNKLSKFVVPYDTKLFYESKFGFAYEIKKSFFSKIKIFLCYKIFENLEILKIL